VQNFPEKIKEGTDDCLNQVYPARFLHGFMGDAQDLWLQARNSWGASGIEPVTVYEVVQWG
jgi:hypothetical protein